MTDAFILYFKFKGTGYALCLASADLMAIAVNRQSATGRSLTKPINPSGGKVGGTKITRSGDLTVGSPG